MIAALRLPSLLLLPLLLMLGVGCGGSEGQLDTSGLGEASYGEAYTGALAVTKVESNGSLTRYDGPASYTTASTLPGGLALSEAGVLSGTPTEVGTFPLEVWVSGLEGLPSFLDLVSFEVGLGTLDVFLGREHDQLTQLSELNNPRQLDMWVRAAGGGGPDMNSYTPNLGVYVAGPNGVKQGGRGDDERIGDVALSEVTVTVSTFEPVDERDPSGPSYPSGHYTDGNPATFDADAGAFLAGSDTGEMDVTFTHPQFGEHRTRLMVVPPDWCTNGFQEGSDWNNAYCE